MSLLRFRDPDSLIPFLCISQPDGRMDGCMGERMDGWPLLDEGRSCRMEEKKRVDINLAEGTSLSLSASLQRQACTQRRQPPHTSSPTGSTQEHTRVKVLFCLLLPQRIKSERSNWSGSAHKGLKSCLVKSLERSIHVEARQMQEGKRY